jgi:phage gpG-like protein
VIEFTVDQSGARARIGRFTPQLLVTLQTHVLRFAIMLQGYVKAEKLSGDPLNRRTGNLSRSINFAPVKVDGNEVYSSVGTNLSYGKVHELGLTIPAHTIQAVRAQALAFSWKGKLRFFKSVQIPDVKMPQRSFLRSSLRENSPQFVQEVDQAVKEAVSESA